MKTILLFCAVAVLASSSSQSQVVPDVQVIFTGRNIYSPTLESDDASGVLRLWYGGWQSEADYPHDNIYFRHSSDGVRWSAPVTVLTPSQMPVASAHVNDPSVVVTPASDGKPARYVMFYTVCVEPCTSNADNQLWSSVSSDGIEWRSHKPLITTGGAAVPSAVALSGAGPARWRVYYSNTSEDGNRPTRIYMAEVDADRNAITRDAVAYVYRGPGVIANPEVRKVGGTWALLFNVYRTPAGATRNTADIFVARSTSATHWGSGSERPLIVNDPEGSVCASVAPGLVEFRGSLLLQFGVARYTPSGTCDFSLFTAMEQVKLDTPSPQ